MTRGKMIDLAPSEHAVSVNDTNLSTTSAEGKSLFLQTGAVFVSDEPCIVSTVLGSCVSVCLWDRRRRVGGMNHFQQPGGDHPDFLAGPQAMQHLLQRMFRLGCQRNHLHALLFGGAQLLSAFVGVNDVGADNVAVARRTLDDVGVAVVYLHVGGTCARKLFFRTDTGGYAVKLLSRGAPTGTSGD